MTKDFSQTLNSMDSLSAWLDCPYEKYKTKSLSSLDAPGMSHFSVKNANMSNFNGLESLKGKL